MMRLKLLNITASFLLLALSISATRAKAQQLIKDYVGKNAVPILTVEPDSVNYADLEPIGDAINDATIVMLGEQDHGDAPTFLAKTRLIKYLHEKKGFNVLAFESDFFSLNEGWDKLPKQELAIDSFLWRNIFPIWTACKSCTNLFFNYIPTTWNSSSPLTITGFDCQQYLNYSLRHLGKSLDSALKSYHLPITKRINFASGIISLIDSSKIWTLKQPADISRIDTCMQYLGTIKKEMSAVVKPDNFWLLIVDNLIQQVEASKILALTKKQSLNARDILMARNLMWLTDVKFKNQKIIVWAADYHTMRLESNMKEHFFDADTVMGDVLSKIEREKKIYSIGFTSYGGEGGRLGTKPFKLFPPRADGFERWIDRKTAYAFVDFQRFNIQYPNSSWYFYMKAMGHNNYLARWNYVFDGIFFIRDMYPCEPSYSPRWIKPVAIK